MHPDVFEDIIKYLNKFCDFIDFSDLDKKNSTRPKIVVTFDDGFKDFETYAFPILKKYNIPVTLNVIVECADTGTSHWTQKLSCLIEEFARQRRQPVLQSGMKIPKLLLNKNEERVALSIYHELKYLGNDEIREQFEIWEKELSVGKSIYTPMMRWSDMRKILDDSSLLKIGNHTWSHLNLQYVTDKAQLAKEINQAKNAIEKNLQVQIDRFSFPNGDFNPESLAVVEENDYKFIQLTESHEGFGLYNPDEKLYNRIQPYHPFLHENLFKIHQFHDWFRRR